MMKRETENSKLACSLGIIGSRYRKGEGATGQKVQVGDVANSYPNRKKITRYTSTRTVQYSITYMARPKRNPGDYHAPKTFALLSHIIAPKIHSFSHADQMTSDDICL
jgi:hypothetical protein